MECGARVKKMEAWVKKRKAIDGAKMGKNRRLWNTAAVGGERGEDDGV